MCLVVSMLTGDESGPEFMGSVIYDDLSEPTLSLYYYVRPLAWRVVSFEVLMNGVDQEVLMFDLARGDKYPYLLTQRSRYPSPVVDESFMIVASRDRRACCCRRCRLFSM